MHGVDAIVGYGRVFFYVILHTTGFEMHVKDTIKDAKAFPLLLSTIAHYFL